jgi:hypothetical protein
MNINGPIHACLRGRAAATEHPLSNGAAQRGRRRVCELCLLVSLLFSLMVTGCATPPHARKDLLAFFEVGRTTREEVLLKLGQPSGSFEHDRILTYRIGKYGEEGYYVIAPKVMLPAQGATWQTVSFSLVIVFDAQGRIEKHQLVQVD